MEQDFKYFNWRLQILQLKSSNTCQAQSQLTTAQAQLNSIPTQIKSTQLQLKLLSLALLSSSLSFLFVNGPFNIDMSCLIITLQLLQYSRQIACIDIIEHIDKMNTKSVTTCYLFSVCQNSSLTSKHKQGFIISHAILIFQPLTTIVFWVDRDHLQSCQNPHSTPSKPNLWGSIYNRYMNHYHPWKH